MNTLITLISKIIKIIGDRSSRGFSSFLNKLVTSVAILTLACIFAFIGLLFIVWAIYLSFNSILSPPLAALASGGITILFSLLLYFIIRLLTNSKGRKSAGDDSFQNISFKDFSNDITSHKDNPFLTVVLTLMAGYLIGSSPSARNALAEVIVRILDQYFKISKTKD
jgi:hypothetical protein